MEVLVNGASTSTDALFGGKKVVLFGIVGAFTGTCQGTHVPSYVRNMAALRAKGVDDVVCVAVNDAVVMGAFAKATGADEAGLKMVADWNGALTKALGNDVFFAKNGLGLRSKRYVSVVDNGKVVFYSEEASPGEAKVSTAEELLKHL